MELQFKDHKFRIMAVGDPHEKFADTTEKDAAKIEDYMRLQYTAIEELKPDLVVLMGDNASGGSPDELRGVLTRITGPYALRNIPFAFILGNHDLESGVSDMDTQYDIYRSLPGCMLPGKDEVNDFGDYNLTVKNTDGTKDALNLWFMYSGNRAEPKYNSTYDFVKTEQINWYENKAAELKEKNGGIVPAVLFQHIPVPEEFALLKKRSIFSLLADGTEGQNNRRGSYYTLDRKAGTTGYMGEAPCSPDYNNGQFASWKKTGDVFAAFFGHDHMNDFVGMTDGIVLGQCKTASFRVYGDGMMQGVRVIDLNDRVPDNFETRMAYYRELVGPTCRSLSGRERDMRDRTSVKLETAGKVLPVFAALSAPLILKKLIKRKK